MELLSPAGNIEKLYYAYAYGADAAYIGVRNFSLRAKADNFCGREYERIAALRRRFPGKKLYCALNILFHNRDLDDFAAAADYFRLYPIDAFIIQDLGLVPILRKNFPDAALHLSTQASCVNREAARLYRSLGFRRVVLGREASLREIREIKDAVPDLELEAFCHGAMCVAYAGRCLMSAYLTGRSGQSGECAHTCRWDFDVLSRRNAAAESDVSDGCGRSAGGGEAAPDCGADGCFLRGRARRLSGAENPAAAPDCGGNSPDRRRAAKEAAESGALALREKKRPGEYFPVFEGDGFTAVLSSKDLCMIRRLDDMKRAGLDSIKIEGRMKSIYYVALVTRAYRKALDALDGKISDAEAEPFIRELDNVSHRESGTGFYYGRADADVTVSGAADSRYLLAAKIGGRLGGAEEAAVFAAARRRRSAERAELAALHPAARAARERGRDAHPEKNPPAARKRAGFCMYDITVLNRIRAGGALEAVSPDCAGKVIPPRSWQILDPENGAVLSQACAAGRRCVFYTAAALEEGALLRTEDPDYVSGSVRDRGR